MYKPGYTLNSEVDKLTARFDRIQREVDNCNALIIIRAIDHIEDGDIKRGIDMLKQLRTNLRNNETATTA